MTFITRIKFFLSLVPAIIAAMKAIEDAIPGTGKGEQKLAMLREAMESAYEGATDAVENFDTVWPTVATWIAKQVARFNEIGIFRK